MSKTIRGKVKMYPVLRPAYVGRFQCDGQKCDAKCCRNWHIIIDDATYRKWESIPNKKLRLYVLSKFPKQKTNSKHEVKMESGNCPMLGEDKLCFLQKHFGKEYLSKICATYPRIMTWNGPYTMEGLSLTCPVAAEGALFGGPLKVELAELPETEIHGAESERKFPAGFPEDTLRTAVAILQDKRRSLDARLAALGLYVDTLEDALAQAGEGGTVDALAIGHAFLHADELDELLASLPFDLAAYLGWLPAFAAEAGIMRPEVAEKLQGPEGAATYREWQAIYEEKILAPYGQLLENFLVNILFTTGFPIASPRSLFEDYRLVVYKWKVAELSLIASVPGLADPLQGTTDILLGIEQKTLHGADWNKKAAERVFHETGTPLLAWLPAVLEAHKQDAQS